MNTDPLDGLRRFHEDQDAYCSRYLEDRPATCAKGCSACCSQMVFDVHAVEVEALGQHLRTSGRAEDIARALRERCAAFDRVRLEHPRQPGEGHDDRVERYARAFWALGKDCVFLDAEGACSVFEYRPWSCRRFYVHGPAELCNAASADMEERQARIVIAGDEGEAEDTLHELDRKVCFDPEDDRLDHALLRWLEHRSSGVSESG